MLIFCITIIVIIIGVFVVSKTIHFRKKRQEKKKVLEERLKHLLLTNIVKPKK